MQTSEHYSLQYLHEMTRILAPLDLQFTCGQVSSMPILVALLVFASAFVIDFAETRYVTAVAEKDSHRAAVWSLVMYSMGAVGWVAIVNVSLWLMIPEALGFYCGTRYALRK